MVRTIRFGAAAAALVCTVALAQQTQPPAAVGEAMSRFSADAIKAHMRFLFSAGPNLAFVDAGGTRLMLTTAEGECERGGSMLYFFGLPVGRDMDGFARTELFRPSFTVERPVSYIPSYGRGETRPRSSARCGVRSAEAVPGAWC